MTEDSGAIAAWDEPTLERASLHGCLDEDVETGSPLVCSTCAVGEPPC